METEFEILSAKRSTCNESEAKDMAGCLSGSGRVVCYFPTESAMSQANLFAAAPELLAHLKMLIFGISEGIGIPKDGAAVIAALEAIAKAEGKA